MSEDTFAFSELKEMCPDVAAQIDGMIRGAQRSPGSYHQFDTMTQDIEGLLQQVGFDMNSILTPSYPGYYANGINTFDQWKQLVAQSYQMMDRLG